MNYVNNYICLDEIVYSKQLFLSQLCFTFFNSRMRKEANDFKDDEKQLYDALKEPIRDLISTYNFLINTNLKTKILSRLKPKIFDLSDELLDILLEYANDDVLVDVSCMLPLIDTCKVVYNNEDKLETLMVYLLKIKNRVPEDRIITYADFKKHLDENKCTDDDNKEVILIGDPDIIKEYAEYYRFIVPNNIADCMIHGIYATVNCWNFK